MVSSKLTTTAAAESTPCDFCSDRTTVLYCNSDSAKLCLVCDQICDNCASDAVAFRCAHSNCSVSAAHDRSPVKGFDDCPTPAQRVVLKQLVGQGLLLMKRYSVKLLENQIADAKALVQYIKDHNLGSKHSSNVIEIQIALLETLKEKWRRRLLSDACPDIIEQQKQRKRKEHDSSSTPVTETLPQQQRKLKIVFSGPRT